MTASSTLDPFLLPASQEEQVHALHELLRREGKALLIGKGGEPAMRTPRCCLRSPCFKFLTGCRKARPSRLCR